MKIRPVGADLNIKQLWIFTTRVVELATQLQHITTKLLLRQEIPW